MIPCQRHLFDIPPDVAYLNCAYTAPLLRSAAQAGQKAIQDKQQPWHITSADFFSGIERVRALLACMIAADSDSVAIIPAVSYGIALAANNLTLQAGQTIVVLQDQFPSNIYSWRRLAYQKKGRIKTVARPADGNWTDALLEAIDGATAIAALPNCHWTDGTLIDLVRVGAKCRAVGAALVVDATQSLGAMPFSVAEVQPDFLVTTGHKWLLGPYSLGYCYVAPQWQASVPLEENWLNRAGSENFARLVQYRDDYQKGARRFDMGAVSNFILAPMAAAVLTQLLDWGITAIARTLKHKTDAIAQRAEELGLLAAPASFRAPHMIGVSRPGGFSDELPHLLAAQKVYVSVRGDSVRIAPHLYNTDEEIERLFGALAKAL